MRRRTLKRAKNERLYLARRVLFLAVNPGCARCGCRATEVHHRAGREGYRLLDESRWLPLCSGCHRWVTEHPRDAIELGFSLSRVSVNGGEK